MSGLHCGSGSDRPAVPLVSARQLVATSCSRNKKAIVMITNECPRVRSATTPRTAANSPATTPPTGTNTNGLTLVACVARIAVVYAPSPRNAPCPSDT